MTNGSKTAPQGYLADEDHDGTRRQYVHPQAFWYPELPTLAPEEAAARMTEGTMWIRSVHFEFYYSYAVVEDCATSHRYLVKGIIGEQSWEAVCDPLHKWS